MGFFCLSQYRRGGCTHTIPHALCHCCLCSLPPFLHPCFHVPPLHIHTRTRGHAIAVSLLPTLPCSPLVYTFPLRAHTGMCRTAPILPHPCLTMPGGALHAEGLCGGVPSSLPTAAPVSHPRFVHPPSLCSHSLQARAMHSLRPGNMALPILCRGT